MIQSISKIVVAHLIISIFLLASLTPLIESRTICTHDSIVPSHSALGQTRNINSQSPSQRHPDGLASKLPTPLTTSKRQEISSHRGHFYGFSVYDPSGTIGTGLVTFDVPENITLLWSFFLPFLAGADIDNEGNWYGCDYAGGLYQIDLDYGITYIGPTIGVNGMTYDPATQTWYIVGSNNLYTIDVSTGATTLIGSLGIANTIIGIACNLDGDMYGYDVLWTGDSTLYSIDKATGAATAIGSMGYGFVYAQDFTFDRDDDILYVAGYFNDGSPSALLTCNVTTGQCSIVGFFEGGVEIDGLTIPWTGMTYDDIAIRGIVKPTSGNAGPITPIVKVKNSGLNTETNVPVQLEIGKELISGTIEDFEATNGSYIHFAKLTDSWEWGVPTSGPGAAHSGSNLWATILDGNYPTNMWSCLTTQPFVVPSGANFKFWHWYQFEPGWDGGNVKISTDGGVTYNIITPIGGYPGTLSNNPYMTGQPGYTGTGGTTWMQAEFDLSAYEGMTAIILWETASDSSVTYAGWYIDDVGFSVTSWNNEYNQTAYVSTIAPEEVIELSFPSWTPADLGLVENVNINYNAKATAFLPGDLNPNNDVKEKPFILHYGFFNDVAVTEIISPASGLAETQTPKVLIENPGQNAENVNVSMTIGKALYTTLLEEDFADGVPPAGWGTNYPSNWMSSSTNYAGGEAPEAMFSWTPASVGEHLLYTDNINTTGYTALLLQFKEFVNDYNGDYTLKVQTSTDNGTTWLDAYTRGGGPYDPTTTEVTLTAANGIGSATFMIAWDMSGDSFNINYWYIDDIWMGIIDMVEEYNQTVPAEINPGETASVLLPDWTPADVPFATTIDYLVTAAISINITDGNPADNEIGNLITLSYEHDVGVIEITEPSGPPRNDIIWDNYADDGTGTGLSSQLDTSYPFNSQCADDFQFTQTMDIIQVHWWGAFWNGVTYPNPAEFNIIFYADNGGEPTGAGMDDPTSTALSVYNLPGITGVSYGVNKYEYDVTLDPVFVAEAGVHYWIAIQEVASYADWGQWGWSTNGANPDQLSGPVQGFPLLGTPYWTPTENGDHAFQLSGQIHQGGPNHWWPGTYQIAGIIQNFGVTYSEVNIPVNTKVTNPTGIVVYDETVIIPGPLSPGEMALATFPNITIPNEYSSEGDWYLVMKTVLSGDDHPFNDKKTLQFIIELPPPPPETTATVSGTMGENGWYVSCVTIALTVIDGIWPPGVDYTLYKVDDGAWTNYTEPFIVCDDGQHTVYFYSVYTDGSVEDVRSVSFKIDQTSPSIEMSVEKIGFNQWKFIANVTENTSGISMVQCYIDDLLLGNMTTPGPYQWTWNGKGEHIVTGVAYDQAGNSAESIVTFALNLDQSTNPFISHLLELFIRFLETLPHMFPFLHSLLKA